MAEGKGKNGNFTNAGKGRPKGAKNKLTNLKDAFLKAFDDIGGTEELVVWGKKPQNRGEFYKMITKLFPKNIELSGEDGGALPLLLVLPEIDEAQDRYEKENKPKKAEGKKK